MIRKSLIEEMGGLRNEFDGAQDYDLVFRCVEKTITAHVPRILYHWRVHQVSTADNPISKTYAFEAGQRAIEEHLLRCGEQAEVLPELDRGFYRVRYKVQGNPKISILIPNKDYVKRSGKNVCSPFPDRLIRIMRLRLLKITVKRQRRLIIMIK